MPIEIVEYAEPHVAAVKSGPRLVLHVAGAERSSAAAPEAGESQSELVGLGGNPLFGGDESFHGSLAGFRLEARALEPEEIRRLAAGAP